MKYVMHDSSERWRARPNEGGRMKLIVPLLTIAAIFAAILFWPTTTDTREVDVHTEYLIITEKREWFSPEKPRWDDICIYGEDRRGMYYRVCDSYIVREVEVLP
jgi:hypothetical protein